VAGAAADECGGRASLPEDVVAGEEEEEEEEEAGEGSAAAWSDGVEVAGDAAAGALGAADAHAVASMALGRDGLAAEGT
jgi:hypothetical protein